MDALPAEAIGQFLPGRWKSLPGGIGPAGSRIQDGDPQADGQGAGFGQDVIERP
jgi:hypothetical protein